MLKNYKLVLDFFLISKGNLLILILKKIINQKHRNNIKLFHNYEFNIFNKLFVVNIIYKL